MKYIRIAFVVGITFFATGCTSWVTVQPLKADDRETNGFRFYEAKPLLVVTDTNTQIIYVPNYSRPYSVQFGTFLAKHDIVLETDGALLKKIEDKTDPTEFIKGLIALGGQALTEAFKKSAAAASEPVSGKVIAVYDFIFDDKGNIMELKKLDM